MCNAKVSKCYTFIYLFLGSKKRQLSELAVAPDFTDLKWKTHSLLPYKFKQMEVILLKLSLHRKVSLSKTQVLQNGGFHMWTTVISDTSPISNFSEWLFQI